MYGKKQEIIELKEEVSTLQQENADLVEATESINIANLVGAAMGNSFLKSIYTQDATQYTPHQRMAKSRTAYMTMTYLHSAVYVFQSLTTGGVIEFKTKNSGVQKAMDKFFADTDLSRQVEEIVEGLILTGNAYLLYEFGSDGVLKAKTLPRPELVYISYTDDGEVEYYVVRVDGTTSSQNYEQFSIHNSYEQNQTERGVKYLPGQICHFKSGVDETGLYGQSPICSSLDDVKILREIQRALAVVARYKAVSKKMITTKRTGKTANTNVPSKLKRDIEMTKDYENVITTAEVEIHDLIASGDIDINELVEAERFYSEKITSGIAPSFVLFGNNTTYAVSTEQKVILYNRVNQMRDTIRAGFIKLVLAFENSRGGKTFGEYSMMFQDLDLRSPQETKQFALDLWDKGLVTLKYVQNVLGLEDLEKDATDGYKWELMQSLKVMKAEEPGGE